MLLGWKALALAAASLETETADFEEAEAVRDASDSESESSGSVPRSAQTSDDSLKHCGFLFCTFYGVTSRSLLF